MKLLEAVAIAERLCGPDDSFASDAAPEVVAALRVLCAHARGLTPTECQQKDCSHAGIARMFWPGSEPLVVCAHHERAAKAVANCMGFNLRIEPLVA